jgi:hypothetical protein
MKGTTGFRHLTRLKLVGGIEVNLHKTEVLTTYVLPVTYETICLVRLSGAFGLVCIKTGVRMLYSSQELYTCSDGVKALNGGCELRMRTRNEAIGMRSEV